MTNPDLDTGLVISDTRSGYSVDCEGTHIGEYPEFDEAFVAGCTWMEAHGYYPDAYHVNDHGNVDLLDDRGNVVEGWV